MDELLRMSLLKKRAPPRRGNITLAELLKAPLGQDSPYGVFTAADAFSHQLQAYVRFEGLVTGLAGLLEG